MRKIFFKPKQVDPDYVDLVRYYFVVAEILLVEAIDGVADPLDEEGNPIGTAVLLQVMTDNLKSLADADDQAFRDTVSMKIPYYHYYASLADPVDIDFIFEAKMRVLLYDPATDRYYLESWEEVFINRFKLEDE